MHTEVLTDKQTELMPLLKIFSKDFYLAGGTAIALNIGHRRSLDFDLFTHDTIKRKSIKYQIEKNNYELYRIVHEASEQLHIVVNSVKIAFYSFPHEIENLIDFDGIIRMPSLLDLAAMKAYALGGRAKWKDYVDLYFILKSHYDLDQISERAGSIFKGFFNDRVSEL